MMPAQPFGHKTQFSNCTTPTSHQKAASKIVAHELCSLFKLSSWRQ